jgi:hypothetical protein
VVSSGFSYWLREGVSEYLTFAMSINSGASNEEKPEGRIDQISISIHEEETRVEIQFLEISTDVETRIRIGGYLQEDTIPEEKTIFKHIEYEIRDVKVKCGNGDPDPLRRDGELYVLPFGIENPKVIVHLSNIFFEREFGLLVGLASNSFTISKVDINIENYIPTFVEDGEFTQPRSILFENTLPKESFRTYLAFRRVSMNITVFLATFSITMSIVYYVLRVDFGHTNKPNKKGEGSSPWKEYQNLWKEFYERKRHRM